jgi:hypothetical protein
VYLWPTVSSLELPLGSQALPTRLYEFSRNVAMLKVVWARWRAPIPKLYRGLESCAASGVPQPAMPPTSRTGGMLRGRIADLAERGREEVGVRR